MRSAKKMLIYQNSAISGRASGPRQTDKKGDCYTTNEIYRGVLFWKRQPRGDYGVRAGRGTYRRGRLLQDYVRPRDLGGLTITKPIKPALAAYVEGTQMLESAEAPGRWYVADVDGEPLLDSGNVFDPPYSSGGTFSVMRKGDTYKKYCRSGSNFRKDKSFTGNNMDMRSLTLFLREVLFSAGLALRLQGKCGYSSRSHAP